MTDFRAPEVTGEPFDPDLFARYSPSRHEQDERAHFNGKVITEFRAGGGKVGGPFQGTDLLLLHHTGARSGTERISPLGFQWAGDSLAVFASAAGAPGNPAWFYNLIAHPDATVEVGSRTLRVRARIAMPAERDVIYSRQRDRSPAFAQYESMAAPRRIPVMVLDPVK